MRQLLIACFACALLGAPAVQAQTLKIGGLLETSGSVASLGQPGLEGAELAVEQINKAGGINGKKLELVNINSESDNTQTVSAVKRLTGQSDILALVGPMNTGSSYAVIDMVQRAGIAMVSNGGSRGIVLPVEKKKWIFLAPLTDTLVQKVMLEDMKKKGIERIALLNSDSAFGTSGREQLETQAADYGVKIDIQQTFGNNDKDMTPQLTNIRSKDVQAIVVWSTGPAQAVAVRNIRQLGLDVPVYLSHAANDYNFLRLAGESSNGVLIPSSKLYVTDSLAEDDPQKPVIERFVADYTSRYKRPPATFAGNGYDATMLIAEAIKAAGPDRKAIRDAIEAIQNHVGVTGIYSYSADDHFGILPSSVEMLVVKDGQFTLGN
ncbi:ABC transporter substrate-binding protein [Pusillimonas noertemannii]|uniref:ABC transporter substrate-binding protein n=1 Tax=Pusillimonas noertemannii TaxID=305977 RepID=UPI0002F38941|nr:ABC transporter substrate-binding protein [Pusillimonas noertemannii]